MVRAVALAPRRSACGAPFAKGYEHTVNSHINRLRAKLEPDPAQPKLIVTVWGTGYRFNTEGLALESDA